MGEVVLIYTIVEAKSINDLVKLVNIKTKAGWLTQGGMCYCQNNLCEADSAYYPYCQSIYRMETPKQSGPKKEFVAFPYESNSNKNKNNKKYAPRHTNKNK